MFWLGRVRRKKSDSWFLWGNGEVFVISPLGDMCKVSVQSRGKRWKIGSEFGDLEVVCIRLSGGSVVRKVGDEEVEKNRRDDRTLRNTRVDGPQGRLGRLE
jgi:hypothetical protein